MATSDRRVVLGIDPGTAILGYGAVLVTGDRLEALGYGAITTTPAEALTCRLSLLFDGLCKVLDRFQPTEAAIEQLFFARNVTSAFAVGHARGVALLAIARQGLPVSEYTPPQVKQAVAGYGRATKVQVQSMVRVILNLEEIPRPDDAADALAVAICHANWTARIEPGGRLG